MVIPTIRRNLDMFTSRAFIKSTPIGKWEYRIGKYINPGEYEMQGDWAEYNPGVILNSAYTFFARASFVPEKPEEKAEGTEEV